MMYGGDYDDAINVVDVWLHTHPQQAIWEKDDLLPFDEWGEGPDWNHPDFLSEMDEEDEELLALSF